MPSSFPRHLSSAVAFGLIGSATLTAQSPRSTGHIGEYTPPVVWPVHPRSFDLQHQRIAISYDLDSHAIQGEVRTTLVVTGIPTDSIRLDASQLTIDSARDAGGKRLRFTADTGRVTVRLGQAGPGGGHGRVHPAVPWPAGTRDVFRPPAAGDVDPG